VKWWSGASTFHPGRIENLKEIVENVCIRNTNAFFGFGVENI
jgi:hypothetical protein